MVLKEEQLRVKALLKETITLLCKNGLKYQSGFCIEATIGITVDEDDILLVSMNETVKSEFAAQAESFGSTTQDVSLSKKRLHARKRRRGHHRSTSKASDAQDYSSSDDSADYGFDSSDNIEVTGPPPSKQKPVCSTDREEDNKSDIVLIDIKEEPQDNSFNSASRDNNDGNPQPHKFPTAELSFSSDFSQVAADITGPMFPQDSDISCVGHVGGGPSIVPEGGGGATSWSATSGSSPGAGHPRFSMGDNLSAQPGTSADCQDGQDVAQFFGSPQAGRLDHGDHQCPVCQKTFPKRYSLKRHYNAQHRGVFELNCSVCGKGFSSSTNLRGHMANQHGKSKEFTCQYCHRDYAYKQRLKFHLVSAHGQQTKGQRHQDQAHQQGHDHLNQGHE